MGYGATFGILGGGHGPLAPPPKSAYVGHLLDVSWPVLCWNGDSRISLMYYNIVFNFVLFRCV